MHLVDELMLDLLKYFIFIPFPIMLSRTLQYTSE